MFPSPQVLRRKDTKRVPVRDGFADAWTSVAERLPRPPKLDFPPMPTPNIPLPNFQLPRIEAGHLLPPGVDPVTYLRMTIEGGVHNFLGAVDHIRTKLPLKGALIGPPAGRPQWIDWPNFLPLSALDSLTRRRKSVAQNEEPWDDEATEPPTPGDLDDLARDILEAWSGWAAGVDRAGVATLQGDAAPSDVYRRQRSRMAEFAVSAPAPAAKQTAHVLRDLRPCTSFRCTSDVVFLVVKYGIHSCRCLSLRGLTGAGHGGERPLPRCCAHDRAPGTLKGAPAALSPKSPQRAAASCAGGGGQNPGSCGHENPGAEAVTATPTK